MSETDLGETDNLEALIAARSKAMAATQPDTDPARLAAKKAQDKADRANSVSLEP
jgi:hypothetical protein